MNNNSNQVNEATPPITSFWVLVCRVAWLFGGPVVLAFLILKIANTPDGWIAGPDLAFLVVLVSTVTARWIAFRSGDRSNSLGEITTLDQLRRYSVVFLAGGGLVWIAANIIGNHLRS